MEDAMFTHQPTRRHFLGWLGVTAAMPIIAGCGANSAQAKGFPVQYSDAEWRKRLTPEQFTILRQDGTEQPFSSPLLDEHRKGIFLCVADGNPLFDSHTKFDSGTGWPSFWEPLPHAVETRTDLSGGIPRTEVHCARCGGHLGHVFDDGPPPTGKRYCMDGVAMSFRAA